jgi:hypothetical protein
MEWTVILSPEVLAWQCSLRGLDAAIFNHALDLLKAFGNTLKMPWSRALGDGLFELRFSLSRNTVDQRITYIFEPGRRVVTLTGFTKTRRNEAREVRRARVAQADYINNKGENQ